MVDRRNSSLATGLDFVVDDPDGMAGNPAVVSNLPSCKRPLKLRESEEYRPSIKDARKRFEDKVMPFIDDSKIKKALLTILYVIETDETIEGERKERFREYLGMYKDELLQQTAFNAPDFFARVLLYTTWVDNKEGFPYAEKITNAFIEETVKNSWAELKWDATTQTVEIIPTEEQRLHDEIMRLSEFRHSVISEPMLYTDLSWMGIDERDLFPNRRHIEFKDHKTKTEVLKKLSQYVKLLNEFVCCLVSMRQSALGQAANWPIFPDEKMRDIRQELENLSDELFTLGLFGERFFIE